MSRAIAPLTDRFTCCSLRPRRDSAVYPRVLVVAESGAQCTVIEDFVGLAEGAYLTDAVSEFHVAENARVSHVRLQREAPGGFHIANTAVRVARGGFYGIWTIALGARISRHDLSITQAGEATEFSIDGLALIGGRQLADMHSSVDHAHAQGRSRQLHKTVVGGGAHAVFNGKILVRHGAQQTDSASSRGTCCSPTRRTSMPSRNSKSSPTTSSARTARQSGSSTPTSCST